MVDRGLAGWRVGSGSIVLFARTGLFSVDHVTSVFV